MADLIRIPIDGGGSLLVEGAPGAAGPVKAGRLGDVVEDARSSLQAALTSVAEASSAVLEKLEAVGPHEIEVDFGITLSAQAGAVIAKAGSGCHFTVKLTWKNDTPRPGPSH